MTPTRIALALSASLLLPGVAGASHEGLYLIAQPFDIEGPGIIVVTVPYVGYSIDWEDPAAEVMLTTAPDSIWCDRKIQNRNLASRYGVTFAKVVPERTGELGWPRVVGDTVFVMVDMTEAQRTADSAGGAISRDTFLDALLEVTLWCGLRNARTRWPIVKYVRYAFLGDPVFHRHSGLYSLERIARREGHFHPEFDSLGIAAHRVPR